MALAHFTQSIKHANDAMLLLLRALNFLYGLGNILIYVFAYEIGEGDGGGEKIYQFDFTDLS